MSPDDGYLLKAPLIEAVRSESLLRCGMKSRFLSTIRWIVGYCSRACLFHVNDLAIIVGPLAAFLPLMFLKLDENEDNKVLPMLAVMIWVVIWWITDAVPIAITSLVPLFLLPFLEIQTADEVSKSYMNDTIFLLIGSFILAIAVEHYNLHKRVALHILSLFGGEKMRPRLILLGFCLGSAFISMWINNTAAAVMMMPVGLGVLQKVQVGRPSDLSNSIIAGQDKDDVEKSEKIVFDNLKDEDELANIKQKFCRGVILAITFSVSIGGMATLTGTGVNMILAGMWESAFPNAPPVTYMRWMLFAFPLALALVLVLWVYLCVFFCPPSAVRPISESLHCVHIKEELIMLGPMPFADIAVVVIFSLLIILWMTRTIGNGIPGWSNLFHGYPGDGTVSVLMATLLFVIPNGKEPGKKIMDWQKCKSIRWSVVLLLGGGFALADGIRSSGLSSLISTYLDFLQSAPYLLIAPIIAVLTGIMTEFTSNSATATIFIPLVQELAVSIDIHPLFLMVPATIGSQFSYMLPIATPPNAIGYSTGYLRMMDIAVSGFVLKLCGIVFLAVLMPTLGSAVFRTGSPLMT
eukprot:c21614_g1_i1 orf=233-1966(+)